MGYFGFIAKQAFKTAPDGRRLFYTGGLRSRPYVIPDEAVEQRLFTKQLWILRLTIGPLIIGQPVIFLTVPNIMKKPLWFIGYVIAIMAATQLASHLMLRGELAKLERADSPIPVQAFYANVAADQSTMKLSSLLLCSLLFVVAAIWILLTGRNIAAALLGIILFGGATLVYVYILFLKFTGRGVGPKAAPAGD